MDTAEKCKIKEDLVKIKDLPHVLPSYTVSYTIYSAWHKVALYKVLVQIAEVKLVDLYSAHHWCTQFSVVPVLRLPCHSPALFCARLPNSSVIRITIASNVTEPGNG